MADQTPTPDELPKAQVAKKVISSKRKYFFPPKEGSNRAVEVEADSPEEAEKLAEQQLKENEGR